MKFTDGYWQKRKGMTPGFPAQIYEVETQAGIMTVYGFSFVSRVY